MVNVKFKVDEQQDDITYLREQCNKHDKGKFQEISGAGTPMKKNKYVCVTCNRNFKKKNIVEKSYHGRAHDPV